MSRDRLESFASMVLAGSGFSRAVKKWRFPEGLLCWIGIVLLIVQFASACEVVIVQEGKVGRNAVIAVTRNEHPLLGVVVLVERSKNDVKTHESRVIAQGTTDEKGHVRFTGLPFGNFSVSVMDGNKPTWVGNLQVLPGIAETQLAVYEMFPKYPSPKPPKELQASLTEFRGVVLDPTGAVIPNVDIEVHEDSEARNVAASLKTDHQGKFSSQLKLGKYLAAFKSAGFVYQKVAISVDTKGWGGMQLNLAISTDCGDLAQGDPSKIAELEPH